MIRLFFVTFFLAGVVYAAPLDKLPLMKIENGVLVPFQLREDTRYIAFYYSASWCSPCRKTTPPLVQEYQRMLDRGRMPVEIVLVGSDETEGDMIAYMKKYGMIWSSLAWDVRGEVNKYAAEGIPHLVLVEIDSGKVISHGTGPGAIEAVVGRMREITGVDADSPFRIGNWLSEYGVLIAVALCLLVIFFIQKYRERREVK